MNQSDHDLLVVVNERLADLVTAVKATLKDHEDRLRFIEKRINMALGAVALLYFLAAIATTLYFLGIHR